MSNIPAGYRLSFTSWENDADNYNTIVFDGLSELDVKFLVELGKLLRTSYRADTDSIAFGGSCDLTEEVMATAIDKVFANHPLSDHAIGWKERLDEVADDRAAGNTDFFWAYAECLTEIVGYPGEGMGGYDEHYFRVMDSYTVHKIETEILDVTASF